jgi:3-mercaptopyruvate sulfurtransferase SseA
VRALLGGWNEWVKDGNPVAKGTKPAADLRVNPGSHLAQVLRPAILKADADSPAL